MRRSPEKLIERLRNHKGRIKIYAFFVVVSLALLMASVYLLIETYGWLLPDEEGNLALTDVAREHLSIGAAFLQVVSLMLVSVFGLAVGLLISEVTTFTKNDLLVQLWDRVHALERCQPVDPQPTKSDP